jgi:hypothetical protein
MVLIVKKKKPVTLAVLSPLSLKFMPQARHAEKNSSTAISSRLFGEYSFSFRFLDFAWSSPCGLMRRLLCRNPL